MSDQRYRRNLMASYLHSKLGTSDRISARTNLVSNGLAFEW